MTAVEREFQQSKLTPASYREASTEWLVQQEAQLLKAGLDQAAVQIQRELRGRQKRSG
jgi:hypothetical protein